jgi:hypothetical protein
MTSQPPAVRPAPTAATSIPSYSLAGNGGGRLRCTRSAMLGLMAGTVAKPGPCSKASCGAAPALSADGAMETDGATDTGRAPVDPGGAAETAAALAAPGAASNALAAAAARHVGRKRTRMRRPRLLAHLDRRPVNHAL